MIPYLIGNDGTDFNPVQNLLDDLFSQKGKENDTGKGFFPDNYDDVLAPILNSFMAISINYAISLISRLILILKFGAYRYSVIDYYPIIYHVLMIIHLLIGSIIIASNLLIKGHPGIELFSMYSAVCFPCVVINACILPSEPLAFVGIIMNIALLFSEVIPGFNFLERFSLGMIFIAPLHFLSSYIIWNKKAPSEEYIPTGISNKI